MRNYISSLLAACWVAVFSLTARADYSVTFVHGYTAFANHLDHPGGNRAGLLFPSPQDGMMILKWDGGAYVTYTYDSVLGGWTVLGLPSEPIINPGEGAFLYAPTAFTNTFTGTVHTPALPVELIPGQFSFLSDQAAESGSWQTIVGDPPIEGSQVFVYDVASQLNPSLSNFVAYTFRQGAWQPSTPSIPIGVSAFFSTPLLASGWVSREFYFDVNTNHAGGGIADLLADAKYPNNPSITNVGLGFRINNDIVADNYGARIQAYFTPSTTGAYEFFMYNDDAARLFLGTNSFEASLQMLIDSPSVHPIFDTSVMGTSPVLIAGQSYLLRALFRQNTGAALLGVATRLQGATTPPASLPVLGGNQISSIVYPAEGGNITFLQQPTGVNATTGNRARFSVSVTSGGPPIYYQWLSNGVTIPNADRATYVTPALSTNDSGTVYLVQVSAGGQTLLSAPANLWVGPGITPRLQPYIGVNFLSADVTNAGETAAGFLRTNDVAGVVAQESFVNLAQSTANGVPLVDSHGNSTPVTISYASASNGASGTGASDADHALFQGYIQNTNNPITLTFSNVPSATNYSLLVYSLGATNNTTYEEAFSLVGQTIYPTLHVHAQDASQYLAAPGYARMSSTDPSHRDLGNYVQFDNVRPGADGTLVVVITPESGILGSAPLPPVNALQLVSVGPAPTLPSLSISHVALSKVTIAWDATAVGYVLESSPTLGANTHWTPVAGVSIPIANSNSVDVSTKPSSTTFLTMIKKGPPFIINQPQSQVVPIFTSNVTFSVTATGAPPITYQWTFNGVNITNATNAAYTIPTPVDFTNVGDYQVTVIDDAIQSLVAGLSVYNGGTLETPISQFSNAGCFTCTNGGTCFNRYYVPRDTNQVTYLFYGPNAYPQKGIFQNNNPPLPHLDIDANDPTLNEPVPDANIAVELQNNFWPQNPPVRCGFQPPQFTLSTQSGSTKNSYVVTVLYYSPPDPASGKVACNLSYQP